MRPCSWNTTCPSLRFLRSHLYAGWVCVPAVVGGACAWLACSSSQTGRWRKHLSPTPFEAGELVAFGSNKKNAQRDFRRRREPESISVSTRSPIPWLTCRVSSRPHRESFVSGLPRALELPNFLTDIPFWIADNVATTEICFFSMRLSQRTVTSGYRCDYCTRMSEKFSLSGRWRSP